MEEKEDWIDIVKSIACILVMLGHLFQSMVKSRLIEESNLYLWFNDSIYLFHVSLFFICSGYLYQKKSIVRNWEEWRSNIFKKMLILGIPYVTFSTITYLLKLVFNTYTNDNLNEGYLENLLLLPVSPYWFLYTLFFLFFILPTFQNKKEARAFIGIGFLLYFLVRMGHIDTPFFFVNSVCVNALYFLAGMLLTYYDRWKRFNKQVFLLSLLFFPLTIICYDNEFSLFWRFGYNLLAGALGILLVMQTGFWLQGKITKSFCEFSREYTLSIFLMHTIFAAGTRSVLMKIGITNPVIHIFAGITASLILPIMATWIAKKTRYLYFFINPIFVMQWRKSKAGK